MTKIRSISVFSAAKVSALLYGVLGLLLAPFMLLGPGLAMMGEEKRPAGVAGVIALAAVAPVIYGVIGFLVGAVLAFLYNAISHSVGGIEVELDLPPGPIASAPPAPIPSELVSPSIEAPPADASPAVRPEIE